ncbi:hypothetical protein [Pantoea sp. 1.19]|uniref:transcriptional antitermination N peptide n=1 Tax=Pantoea sp. 1.19 TaxID=1925589 RepID=UPI0009490565|nr:hypothetical protein [Pantoea sp. 1.19]
MNSKQRYNAKRAAAHRAKRRSEPRFVKIINAALYGSDRVSKALSSIDYKMSPRPSREEIGGTCLPDVAIYAAGYRKSNGITAR